MSTTQERPVTINAYIKSRFDSLEKRRLAFNQRVFALTYEQLHARPIPKAFTAGELLEHFAISEQIDLDSLHQTPPWKLAEKSAKPTFVYHKVVDYMFKADGMAPSMPSLTPKGKIDIQESAKKWNYVRSVMREYLIRVDDPDAAFCKMPWYLGTLSANHYLSLLDAHMHYHEVRFPKV